MGFSCIKVIKKNTMFAYNEIQQLFNKNVSCEINQKSVAILSIIHSSIEEKCEVLDYPGSLVCYFFNLPAVLCSFISFAWYDWLVETTRHTASSYWV